MKLQLLYFQGCPNIEPTRACVASVLRDFPGVKLEEVDVRDASTPEALRGWGSPTLLVNGVDLEGTEPSGSCCRLYQEHEPGSRGVPSAALLRRALLAADE